MSDTLANVALNVRLMLRDTDDSPYVVGGEAMGRAIIRQAQLLGSRCRLGESWSTGALTLSDTGSPDFAFASGVRYSMVRHLRLASTGVNLNRRSSDEIERLRATASPQIGPPTDYYLIESSTQVLSARLWPRPIAADTVDALLSSLPPSTYTDATVIPFSDYLLRAVESAAAAQLAKHMDAESRARLKLDASDVSDWLADAERGVRAEQLRQARFERVSQIPAQVG